MLRCRLTAAWIVALAACASGPVFAHAVDHRVETGEAVLISLSAGPEQPLADAPYRVFGPEPGAAFASGRTDRHGTLAWRPDRPGTWRVIVSAADGHGASIRVEVDDELAAVAAGDTRPSRWLMLPAGVGYILGLAGLLALWKGRR